MQNPNDATMRAWDTLLVAHRRLTNQMDAELRSEAGVSIDEYDVLYQIGVRTAPLRMSDLADKVLISRASTSRLVDRLVARQWVERWHDSSDRRVVLVRLTLLGKRERTRLRRIHRDSIRRLVELPLAGYDVGALSKMLGELVASDASE